MKASSTRRTSIAKRSAAAIGVVVLTVAGCGGGDDDGGDGSGAESGGAAAIAVELSERAQTEFVERGEGVFFDTGFMSYCRVGSGFDGILAELGYTDDNAPDGYELCYNVNDDLTVVALGVTSMRTGETTCVRLDASTGELIAGQPESVERCLP